MLRCNLNSMDLSDFSYIVYEDSRGIKTYQILKARYITPPKEVINEEDFKYFKEKNEDIKNGKSYRYLHSDSTSEYV